MKKILSIICLVGLVVTVSAQSIDPGSGGGGGDEYRMRDNDYVWGEDDDYCVVQCILPSILDCIYYNNDPNNC